MESIKTVKMALELLGLSEFSSIRDIKSAYRDMAHKYHPDKCKEKNKKKCEDVFKRILDAKVLLIEYCENYPISFSKGSEQVGTNENDLKEHYERFYSNWFVDFNK